jgi:hypothetical protein
MGEREEYEWEVKKGVEGGKERDATTAYRTE